MAGVRVDASDLKKVARMAKEFSPELNRQLMRQLRSAGKLGAGAAKEGIQQMPTSQTSPRYVAVSKKGKIVEKHLRDLISDAITVNVATTARPDVRIRVRRTPALNAIGAGGIAKAINKGKWRHPVYGNRNVWVDQTGTEFFDRRIQDLRPAMQAAVLKALNDARDAVTKGRL